MRLKQLSIQGFKTFVPRTDLVFGEGLTAIVGPNGSGKSNVADAVRWVLGEQSLSQLRAKKTEDLIFAGSSTRAPLSMAEVSITIDNTDRLLPIEFAEVVLTRRAFRSGENEYYINKSRVRLRDVLDLASSLGQAYTVVGQGLIDAALSLRPEERRELFEEAAAIRGYFVQREDALKRLARTEENVARVNDLATELEPQVRRLERQARQTQEYARVEAELHSAMAVWYRERWRQAVAGMRTAEEAESSSAETARGRKAALDACNARLAATRSEARSLTEKVALLHEQRARDQARRASHLQTQAVMSERLLAARAQLNALEVDRSAAMNSGDALEAQLSATQSEVAERESSAAALMESSREMAGRVAQADKSIAAASRSHADALSSVDENARRTAELRARLEEVSRRKSERERGASESELAISTSEADVQAAQRERDARHTGVLAAQQALAEAEAALTARQVDLASSRSRLGAADNTRREAQRKVDLVAGQIASIVGEQQASLHGGVRAAVTAMTSGKIAGFVGTVAELFRVPDEYEIAIEAALGGRLQDVVVDTWNAAEAAIAHLKRTGGGRATFLPLDSLRSGRLPQPPRGPGVVGVALDLVEFEERVGVVAAMLLGRLLVVDDLAAARRSLREMHEGAPWTIVTLGGEVIRPGGSVTGGADMRADDPRRRGRSLLGRERRLREQRVEHERLLDALRQADADVELAAQQLRQAEHLLAEASNQTEEKRRALVGAQMAHVEQQNLVARLSQELAWRTGLLADARNQIEALESEAVGLHDAITASVAAQGPLKVKVDELGERLAQMMAQREEMAHSMGDRQTRLAVLEEAIRNWRARERQLTADLEKARESGRQLHARIERLTSDIVAIEETLAVEALSISEISERLVELESGIGPSEQGVRGAEAEISRLEPEQAALQSALLDAETAHSRASVERQRCSGVLDSLRVEVIEEMGHTNPDGGRDEFDLQLEAALDDDPLRWPLPEPESSAPDAQLWQDLAPQERERRVYALKARLARLGPVNPLAMEEHQELSERHSYLQAQLVDLVAAAESLKRVIAELDRTMRDQFAQTFVQVNEAFEHFFVTLFGGGHARLELTNPDDIANSGVEILAQAPGKRMQPLAALSGGERALTSAALLFALLRVRPVPFCVLDEVDAALDESNVTRFRNALQELGVNTQFVVITHNRGTIEAADTLYGVSMAGDGTSKLLSLKVHAESLT